MKWMNSAFGLMGLMALGGFGLSPPHIRPLPQEEKSPQAETDPTELEAQATQVLDTYCVSCHGPDRKESDIRLDQLETLDAVDRQELLERVQQVIHLSEMPPQDSEQPKQSERKLLVQWLDRQLTGEVAQALAEKLLRFEFGNVVNHRDLFSGDYADLPGYTPNRRWLISEFIFNEKVNRLLDYQPTRTIYGNVYPVQGDSGIHWSPKTERGNKFRRTITNPFLLPEAIGVRYSMHRRLTTGHLLTMVGNAKRIAGYMASEAAMKAHYPAMHALMKTELDHRRTLLAREKFMREFSFMDRMLREVFGDQHESLLPELNRIEIPYPGPPQHSQRGIQKRHENLGFLGRFNKQDIQAILQGIATYKTTGYEVQENVESMELDRKGVAVWAPYSDANRAEFDRIIVQSERDWHREGVTEYRIRNRITTMKLFFDTWDMNRLYQHVQKGGFEKPEYQPLRESEMRVMKAGVKKHRHAGDRYQQIIEKCLVDWNESFRAERNANGGANAGQVKEFIIELYQTIHERFPTDLELSDAGKQFNRYLLKLDRQQAIEKMIESLVLSTEFAYRTEFGKGEPDQYGRQMMSPRDASYALAYALTDSSPDETLVEAAEAGRLNSRRDYEREVRRLLNQRDQWTIIDEGVQAANLNASVTNLPIRKLRFFREFFGYPAALGVFKDDSRFGAGRHEQAVSRLIDEADMLVEHVLKKDEHVIETLLTTENFFIYHSGDNDAMQAGSDELKRVYDYFRDLEFESWEPEAIEPHKEFMLTIWQFRKVRGGDNKALLTALKRLMPALEQHFSNGQSNGMPYMKTGMGFWHGGNVVGRTGQQMRGEQVTSYWNLDWRNWDYPTQQPARIDNRKGILTHPAWLIAHSQNLETDPIHRGKWIREKLLAGVIPDVPITVDAVIPPDHHKTLRQRMEDRTGDTYCWSCHQKMDPLGFPFEMYDDFGRFRIEESLEHPDNLVRAAKRGEINEFGATLPIYKTLPVDPRGLLDGTDDLTLDGDVENAFDLIDRLAKSDKVRQSIIRHAFRYFLGRNETLADSKTLIEADQAYLNSRGSFDEVIVSLLCSDSFIYRKRETRE